jgi:hypothetical protein
VQKCTEPRQSGGDHVATKQRALAEKEWQIGDFDTLKPVGERLMNTGFENEANGKEIEVSVVAGDQELGRSPKDKTKNQGAAHQKVSVLLRQ